MKRTFLFTALAAMLVATSCAGSGSKSEAESISTKKEAPKRQGWDNEIYGPLYGNVESITVTLYHLTEKNGEVVKNGIKCKDNYKFDREGNVVEKTSYDSDDLQVEKDLYKYDSRGNMIEEDYSYYRGSGYKSKNTYKYDSQGNIVERELYHDGSLSGRYLYKYDSQGNMIEEAHYDGDGSLYLKRLCKYDSQGNEIEVAHYNGDGSLTLLSESLYKYDSQGKMIESAVSYNGSLPQTAIYKYDSQGNIIEVAWYDCVDVLECEFCYKYDSRGNMIEEDYSYYRSSGYKSKNTYKYDPQNNYIERVRYEGEAMMPVDVNVREIVYRE